MEVYEFDYLIIGSGMVGMSIAHQLDMKYPNKKICIIDKEKTFGLHSSGRNSGVIHAGIYYKPESLKANLCIEGSKRLKEWCKIHNVNVLECGKVITPQSSELDFQLDILLERGIKNGANVEIINLEKFQRIVPNGRTSTGRALWSPKTSIVDPYQVIKKLYEVLNERKIKFFFNKNIFKFDLNEQSLHFVDKKDKLKSKVIFKHVFNCAGLGSDQIGKLFGVGKDYVLLPFKGIYWKLRKQPHLLFDTNLYPVPDLNMPFLGVHVTPSIDGNIYLGPTAIPAFGAENYNGFKGIQPLKALNNLKIMGNQWLYNKNNFRRYSSQQAILGIKYFFFKSAKELIPNLTMNDIIPCKKVGIRPQLFCKSNSKLVDDFYIENTNCSTHILNAISPAFTASFSFADYVINFALEK